MAPAVASRDTIVAIATAAGRSALGVVRLSGADVPRIGAAILGELPPPRHAALRSFRAADGGTIDLGLALYFPAPASFTGEPVLELQGHGGMTLLDALLERAVELGARLARPGEFTERAFLNGKLDLAQAEAVADLIDASTAQAARSALRSLQGEFSATVAQLQAQITELRTLVEAAIDFPDEDLESLSGQALDSRLARLFSGFAAIGSAARQGALLREGLRVVIAGKPNAGKSSLLNRLVGEDVAIVSDAPGTTRDLLRHPVHLEGLPIHLTDTAGLRTAVDGAEREGIRRAHAEMGRADRVLYVLDATVSDQISPLEVAALPAGVPVTWVLNKIDLVGANPRVETLGGETRVLLSAHTAAGLDLLRAHLKAVAGYQDAGAGVFSARRRHLNALAKAEQRVRQAQDAFATSGALELFAEELRLAQRSLSDITGEFTSDDLLGEIFGSFCIGK